MGLDVGQFDISKTYRNVILSNVTGSSDNDGVPESPISPERTGNESQRTRGRLQDAFGTDIPLVLSPNLIESEAEPKSSYSLLRRCDYVAIAARQHINSLIWS